MQDEVSAMEMDKTWAFIKRQFMFTEVFGLGRAAILKMPAAFADQFYHLSGYITFVHTRLLSEGHPQ
jgi:hypothetical protein